MPEQSDFFFAQPEPLLPPQGVGTLRSREGQGARNLAAAQGAAPGCASLLPSGLGAGRANMPRTAVHSGTRSLIGAEESPGTWRSAVSLRLDKQNAGNELETKNHQGQASLTHHKALHIAFETQKQVGSMLDT